MSYTLYHYVHCPYCIRVRLALGFLQVSYQSIILPYDDEDTPLNLCQKKMLPILDYSDGAKNESLDIISILDTKNSLKMERYFEKKGLIDNLLKEIGSNVHPLCMPYWIYTPEFDSKSRKYFQHKKEASKGPFHKLIAKKGIYISQLETILAREKKQLNEFYLTEDVDIFDILLCSHLWGMYIFPEFQFDDIWNKYLQRVGKLCEFSYHSDFWHSNNARPFNR